MTDEDASATARLRDARPDGLCTQTFFRNHDVVARCLSYASQRQPALRVWDIGGGVLELLLIAALCDLLSATRRLSGFSIVNLDSSAEVAAILEGAESHQKWSQGDRVIVDEQGKLKLLDMATIFSATHAEVNAWLTDPVAVSAQIQQWLDLGLGPYFGIPANVCHTQESMRAFLADGLSPQGSLYTHLRHIVGDIGDAERLLEDESPYDVVLSNYALQYPIWEGRGQQVLEQIERHLAPQGILQVANAYSAEQALISLLASSSEFSRARCVEVSLREIFVVPRYSSDAHSLPPRLVPRVDIFCTPLDEPISGIQPDAAQALVEHFGGRVVSLGSLMDLSDLMEEYTGLEEGGSMVLHGWWNPREQSGYTCLIHRDVIQSFGRNRLRSLL